MLRGAFLVTAIVGALAFPNNAGLDSPARVYNTPEIIQSWGYVAQRHHVITSDGYILEMHRIPFKRHETQGSPDRPVVFLMHGLMAASNSFIALGTQNSIACNLADAGYDVWMGNGRGTRNSRFNVRLDPDSTDDRNEFWDFSWEEIGSIDIAAMVDYVLETTGKPKLHYLGHSQGGTVFLVLCSMRPEYNDKFASVHLLAGVGYMDNFPNAPLRALAQITTILYNLALSAGFLEVFPPSSLLPMVDGASTGTKEDVYALCAGDIKMKELCDQLRIKDILGDPEDADVLSFGGAAFKQIAHFGQCIRDSSFARWNYGIIGNMQNYGSLRPPIFDLSLIIADVTMHYTISDILLHERDVHRMAEDMPNTKVRRVSRDNFQHEDFVAAPDVRELVTEYIIEYIANVESRPQ